jgi:hypothetical protein
LHAAFSFHRDSVATCATVLAACRDKKLRRKIFVASATCAFLVLVGCSGGSGGGALPTGGSPPPSSTITPVQFKGVIGTAPADAALGQPLTVEWTLPQGFTISSVQLGARATSGELNTPLNCSVSSGPLAATATSATITIPNVCEGRTVHSVDLQVTVTGAGGQQSSDTHSFFPPASFEAFVPQRTDLPILRLTTDSGLPVTSKEEYVTGEWSLASDDTSSGALEIRGRGNSTWDLSPKKSYRLRLEEGQSLLGMPSSRHWVLLANHSDKTLLRNALAMELGERLGMAWTPHTAAVELFLNGRYDGVYLLSENIRVDEDRVNIDELSEEDVSADKITGGYLLEVDFRQDGYTMITAIDELPIVFQDPEQPTPEQEAYIKNYIDELESVLHSDSFADPASGYAAYIDVDSFIRWYFVNEIFRNIDSNMWSSCWMYKPRDGKLHMGPVWDFDLAAGNANYDDAFKTDGWWVREAPWFSRLFEDPAFANRAREIWNEINSDQLPEFLAAIHTRAASMQQAQLNNFQRWPILETYVWPNYTIPGTYAGEIAYLDEFLRARIEWIDSQLNP